MRWCYLLACGCLCIALSGCFVLSRAFSTAAIPVHPWTVHDARVALDTSKDHSVPIAHGVEPHHIHKEPGAPYPNRLVNSALFSMAGHTSARNRTEYFAFDTVRVDLMDGVRIMPIGSSWILVLHIQNDSEFEVTVHDVWLVMGAHADDASGTVREEIRDDYRSTRVNPWMTHREGPHNYFRYNPLEDPFLIVVPGEEIIYKHDLSHAGGTGILFVSLSSEAVPGMVQIQFDCDIPEY